MWYDGPCSRIDGLHSTGMQHALRPVERLRRVPRPSLTPAPHPSVIPARTSARTGHPARRAAAAPRHSGGTCRRVRAAVGLRSAPRPLSVTGSSARRGTEASGAGVFCRARRSRLDQRRRPWCTVEEMDAARCGKATAVRSPGAAVRWCGGSDTAARWLSSQELVRMEGF